jgi:hypothetical protein
MKVPSEAKTELKIEANNKPDSTTLRMNKKVSKVSSHKI